MDGYLDRLKNFQKRPTTLPTKPTKPDFGGFDGFVGTTPRGSQNFFPRPGDASQIKNWLGNIGETDEQIITEVMQMCAADPDALAYYLDRATEGRREAA